MQLASTSAPRSATSLVPRRARTTAGIEDTTYAQNDQFSRVLPPFEWIGEPIGIDFYPTSLAPAKFATKPFRVSVCRAAWETGSLLCVRSGAHGWWRAELSPELPGGIGRS